MLLEGGETTLADFTHVVKRRSRSVPGWIGYSRVYSHDEDAWIDFGPLLGRNRIIYLDSCVPLKASQLLISRLANDPNDLNHTNKLPYDCRITGYYNGVKDVSFVADSDDSITRTPEALEFAQWHESHVGDTVRVVITRA